MKLIEILENLNSGKFVVWIDDKKNAALTPEYMETHFVCLVDSLEEGYNFCTDIQKKERESSGKSTTRYRISGLKEDFVCSEDLDQETIERLNRPKE